jgi:hypothetical protein
MKHTKTQSLRLLKAKCVRNLYEPPPNLMWKKLLMSDSEINGCACTSILLEEYMNIKEYLNKSLPNKSKITNKSKRIHYDFFERYGEKEWLNLTLEMLRNSDKFPLDEEIGCKMYKKYTRYQHYGNLRRLDLQDLSIWILENWEEYLRNLYPEIYRDVNLLTKQPQRKVVITPSTFDDLFEFA